MIFDVFASFLTRLVLSFSVQCSISRDTALRAVSKRHPYLSPQHTVPPRYTPSSYLRMPRLPRVRARRTLDDEAVVPTRLVRVDQVPRPRATRSTARLGIPSVIPIVEGPDGVQLTQIQPHHLSAGARRRAYTTVAPSDPSMQRQAQTRGEQVLSHNPTDQDQAEAQPDPNDGDPSEDVSATKRRTAREHLRKQADRWNKDIFPNLLQPFLEYLRRAGSGDTPQENAVPTCLCSSHRRPLRLLVLYFNSSSCLFLYCLFGLIWSRLRMRKHHHRAVRMSSRARCADEARLVRLCTCQAVSRCGYPGTTILPPDVPAPASQRYRMVRGGGVVLRLEGGAIHVSGK